VIIRPPRLKQGDRIGIIAPAGPVTQQELQPSLDLLTSNGYIPELSSLIFETRNYLAGEDSIRLERLHAMFSDEGINAIICARGGYGTLRLLDRIDYDLIRSNPKIIVGYSDITALLLSIIKHSGIVTFHGPVARELEKNNGTNLEAFLGVVSGNDALSLNLSEGKVINKGKAEGILLGGNLSLICHLTGTPFLPSLKGAVLFVEDRAEPLYRIDRMLTHLRLSHVLDELAGILIGNFEDCGDISEVEDLFKENFSGAGFPVISGLPVGHGSENFTMPMGVRVEMDTVNMVVSVQESRVSGPAAA
jgi:muramoyltetrapeptide carboxypeptidase